MGEGRFVHVWSTGSAIEAELARARLEAEGIPVLVKGEAEGPYRMGGADLWVPEGLEAQARLILESPPPDISEEELAALAEASADEDADPPGSPGSGPSGP
ncbi:hypothetical protein HRbin12_01206 [bacterium HR12]|nr:hypothetical protein HRbin12_01206 [bacterium HR12]GIV00079.1 MAG: hypothetical protein KatS3mg014_1694 [Actinomycetota bacterium]